LVNIPLAVQRVLPKRWRRLIQFMKKIIIVIISLYFLSCEKEPEVPLSPYNCSLALINPTFLSSCQTASPFIFMYYCQLTHIGDYNFTDSTKLFIPQYCEDINKIFTFEDGSGAKINLEIVSKSYIRTYATQALDHCINDTTKWVGYCINTEYANIMLKSINSDRNFNIELHTRLAKNRPVPSEIADLLDISRMTGLNNYTVEFSSIISQRTYSISKLDRQEFYSSIILHGRKYLNVMSNDISNWPYPSFKYYYNKEFGLLAFIDLNKILWCIK